jgi:serine/threonine protein phosphatase PrpC
MCAPKVVRVPPASHRAIAASHHAAARLAGTTLIAAILRPDRVWVACVGDSRCVRGVEKEAGAGWVADDLSDDQKPDSPGEAERILSSGGRLVTDDEIKLTRVVCPDGRGLAMSRSIGDTGFDEFGVSSEPVVSVHEVSASDRCLILASDGVFEFISSQKAVDICCGNVKSAMKATKALIALSTFKWAQEEGDYRDDITAIVIFLPIFEALGKIDQSTFTDAPLAVYDADGAKKKRVDSVAEVGAEDVALMVAGEPPKAAEAQAGEAAAGDAATPREYTETPVLRRRNLDKRRLSVSGLNAQFTPEQMAQMAQKDAEAKAQLDPVAAAAAATAAASGNSS